MIYVVVVKILRHVLCSSLMRNGEVTVKMFAMRGGDGKWFCAMCGNGDREGKKIYMREIDGKENHLPCNALI